MNKKYVKNSPTTMIVEKENGITEQRRIECEDIDFQLTLENNLEYINRVISDLENFINNDQPFDMDKYYSSLETIAFVTLGGTAVGVLYNEGKALLGGLGIGAVCGAITMIWAGVHKASYLRDVKKRKAAYQAVLEKAYIIKDHITSELDNIRELNPDNDNIAYKVIEIPEDMSFIRSTDMVLNEEYMRNISSKRLQRQIPLKNN